MQALSTAQLVGRDATGFACVPDAETAVAATADASSPRARHEHALRYAARSHATFTRSLLPAPLTRDCASRTITQKSLTVLSVCFRLEARPQADTPMAAGAGVAGMASQQAVQGGGRQQGAAQELRHCCSRTHHALPHALLHPLLHPLLHYPLHTCQAQGQKERPEQRAAGEPAAAAVRRGDRRRRQRRTIGQWGLQNNSDGV